MAVPMMCDKLCEEGHITTNLNLDPALIDAARAAGHHKTKKEAVEAALREYVRRRAQVASADAFGSFVFEPPARYDYKSARKAR